MCFVCVGRHNAPVRDLILDTEVWAWGRGRYGQLGLGDSLDSLQPCKIKALSDKRVIKLAAGARHTLAVTADCKVGHWLQHVVGLLGSISVKRTCAASFVAI